ncbi:signal recognition particle 68 kDa subunit [Tieghemostelium lacteum]|uniref:Signal recognition particle subunit SRP68 n=1 Tax=Tieghemostelium lacteum TaxID=361077 RepID=A0A151ZC32_TIELA|nr:signal recognition particle 68 kDa subunit [Tieghemostelium lacteum]|eukprot:KYQ91500.1 signal recognition particle 68 kDa subunit [Tieghemostelium lacteum]
MTSTSNNTVEIIKYNIDVLNTTQSSQIQFGLRVQDYKKYRHYCSKRIQKLRKQIRKLYGKKGYIQKIQETKQINDQRYLLIMLFKTERAWSYGMDLKAEYEQGTNPRAGFHMSRRFAKAALHATEFEKYCRELADQSTIIEAQAYASWHRSSLLLNKEDWTKALEEITIARTIYDGLSNLGDHSQKDLYLKRIEESDQIIRFCKYNLRSIDNTTLVKEQSNLNLTSNNTILENIKVNLTEISNNQKKDQSKVITWKSKNIKVESEKLKEKLETFEQYKSSNESKLPTQPLNVNKLNPTDTYPQTQIYDKLVFHLINCEVILKNEISHYSRVNAKNKTVKSETEESNLNIILSYVLYHKMKYLYDRNQIIIWMMTRSLNGETFDLKAIKNKKKSTYKDLVRMSTHQIKIFQQMVENHDQTTTTTNKDNDSQVLLLKSKRLYFISVCTIEAKKFSVTMGIMDKVIGNIAVIKKQSSKNSGLIQEVTELESLIKQQKSQIAANSFIEQLQTNEELKKQMNSLSLSQGDSSKNTDIISGQNSFDTSFLEEKKLIDFPPALEPVPVKPLFFDLAFNSVQFPSLEQRKKPVSKGIFGSFWGR